MRNENNVAGFIDAGDKECRGDSRVLAEPLRSSYRVIMQSESRIRWKSGG
jgi:hypothetical protein